MKQKKGYEKFAATQSPRLELSPNKGMAFEASSKDRAKNIKTSQLNSLELFSGAGGLSLGVAKAGFKHLAVLERDAGACVTMRENLISRRHNQYSWPVFEVDVSKFDYGSIESKVDLLAGGPPCQPFSQGGKHRGRDDERNMFPEMLRAVRELKPKAILVENVRGLSRSTFAEYYDYILSQFAYPDETIHKSENWRSHHKRLKSLLERGSNSSLSYNVKHKVLNAADFGVPQGRERVFIVAFRKDLNVNWDFPEPTHSADSLVWDQWVTKTYWDRHQLSPRNQLQPTNRQINKIEKLFEENFDRKLKPWVTVRDAIHDLPDPRVSSNSFRFQNHVHNPGARVYPGHTGSILDLPAKTIKAGSHGVPGGENMIAYPNGKVRYFTVRECARLQTFPDSYVFQGAWCTAMKQLGNAVPVKLAQVIAKSISEAIVFKTKQNVQRKSQHVGDCAFPSSTARLASRRM